MIGLFFKSDVKLLILAQLALCYAYTSHLIHLGIKSFGAYTGSNAIDCLIDCTENN